MLKNTINADAFNTLPEAFKAEYKLTGDQYILQHDEDTGALKRARDREKERADTLAVDLSKEKNEHATTKAASTSKDSPLKIAEDAKTAAMKEVEPKLKRLEVVETRLKTAALTQAASELATNIGGAKNKVALLPHIAGRLDVTLDENDEAQVVVKDIAGKPTALKLTDLETEIRANKDLSSLIVASAASGGAGRQQNAGPGFKQSPASSAGTEKNFGNMTADESKAYITEKYVNAVV